jgi:P-type Ca2+ transporter type 2C
VIRATAGGRVVDFPSVTDAHARPAAQIAVELGVDSTVGLSDEAAHERLAAGSNELAEQNGLSLPRLILSAVTEPFIILLLAAGLLAIALGEVRDGLLVLIGLAPIIGADIVTEYRADRALESLRAAAAPTALVRRNRRALEIPAATLVPGDVVLLRVGDVVPADLRLTRVHGLVLDRSVLTGESVPEPGHVEPDRPDATVADRHAMAYAGTSVVGGRAEGLVVATGDRTEFGRIAGTLGAVDRRRSPLQRELDRLVRILLVVAFGLIALTVGHGIALGRPIGANVLAGISAAIAAIPEEPPVLLAVILGLGAFRLLRQGVLVRRLSAQETLGAVDLILTDKTGTLTENRLVLAAATTPVGAIVDPAARGAVVGEALRAEEDAWTLDRSGRIGSFTRALLRDIAGVGGDAGLDPGDLVDASGPSDERPYSQTRSRRDGSVERLVLGAPEAVLDACGLQEADIASWGDLVAREADAGGRLLLLARGVDGTALRPRALLTFADPLRSGVAEALRLAVNAGIQTILVTGDHRRTAASIARRAGLAADHIVTGAEVAGWDANTLAGELPRLQVVARALPEQKLRLVDAARAAGRTVAVTGDGVNDAPALQHADVAVAMGSGTAVAKGASDLVLGDDSFATLMQGLREGRRMVANVQKGLVFLVSTHVALLGFILIATLAGYDQPLLPVQILWLELFIDLSTSVAFEREPEEPGAMDRPPHPRGRPLLDSGLLVRIAAAGGFSAVAALAVMVLHSGDFQHARWLAYTTLVLAQAARAYGNRSLTTPTTRLAPNRLLATASMLVVGIQLLIPSVPVLADAFRASRLDPMEWVIAGSIALAPLAAADLIRRSGRAWVA